MATAQEAILQAMVQGVIRDLLVKSRVELVYMADGVTTLDSALAELITARQAGDLIDERINQLVDGAPEAFNTLKEIADYITENKNVGDALNAAIGNKVDKVAGKGLSTEDFTTELKNKLNSLADHIHPATHSASIIEETTDRKFMTAAEKQKLSTTGRVLMGATAPADLTAGDLFVQITD